MAANYAPPSEPHPDSAPPAGAPPAGAPPAGAPPAGAPPAGAPPAGDAPASSSPAPSPEDATLDDGGGVAMDDVGKSKDEAGPSEPNDKKDKKEKDKKDKEDKEKKEKEKKDKKKDKKKKEDGPVHDKEPADVLEILILLTVGLYWLGFMDGFVVGVSAVQAKNKSDLNYLLPAEVGISGCAVMTFAAVCNALLHLYSVHNEKIKQIPPLQEQSVIVDRIREKFAMFPDIPVRVGLPENFILPEPPYDVSVPWVLLYMLVFGSAGAFGGSILTSAGHPYFGLLLMFISSIVLKFGSQSYDQKVKNVSLQIIKDNQSLLNIGSVVGVRMYTNRSKVDRTKVDLKKKVTFSALADAMMAGYATGAANPAYQEYSETGERL